MWADELAGLITPRVSGVTIGGFKLATMAGTDSVKLGNITIESANLIFSERLTMQVCTKVSVPESHTDASTYSPALQAGDTVLIARVSDSKYLVLEKVVSL